ncbi:MAG: phosphopantetheine-binding protein [Syntrophales bacterium]|nr:phosphopantetheine-binding protein [Syntrophales bacterium]
MTETVEELISRIKSHIVEYLHIDSMTAEGLDEDVPLFGEYTGFDSIDALELVVLLDKKYGIKILDSKEARKIFVDIRTIAEYVHENRKS